MKDERNPSRERSPMDEMTSAGEENMFGSNELNFECKAWSRATYADNDVFIDLKSVIDSDQNQ